MMALCVTVRDPFRPAHHRQVTPIRKSRRIRALAPRTAQPHICLLNGRAILRAEWGRRVRDGDVVSFVLLPQGGGGGSNPLRIVLMIAVAVLAPAAAGFLFEGAVLGGAMGSFGLSVATAAVGFVGAALVNALIPPPRPPSATTASDIAQASPTYSIGAQGNQARIGQPIPEVFGRHIVFPDFGAMPYTEYAGNDQYLYQLLVIGRGHYDIEQVRIEDTPIGNFDEVATQIIPPGGTVTLFPTRVITSVEVSGQELEYNIAAGPYVANDSATDANLLGFDIVLPRGLYYANDNGGLDQRTVTFRLEYQEIDDTGAAVAPWTVAENVSVTAKTTTPIRRSYRYSVAPGRYQARVTRTSVKDTDNRVGNDLAWTALRAYLPGAQSYGEVTLLAMRIRATDNISQQASRKVNCIVTRKLPTWNGASWTAPVATRNPAWAMTYIARQRLSDSRINIPAFAALAAVASARGDRFDAVFDSFSTVWEALTVIARTMRAMPFLQGGSLQAYRDAADPLPVAMFTPRNILRGSFRLVFKMASEDMADAVDVEYFDSGTWSWRTVRAALAGSNSERPYRFRLYGCTQRAQAWREGMYMVACNRFRRRFVTFQTEMDGFIPSLGDTIAIVHDTPKWGQFAEATAWQAATRTLTLSEPLDWSAGGTHYLAFRARDGAPVGPFPAVQLAEDKMVQIPGWSDLTDPEPDTGPGRERAHIAFGPADAQYIRARVLSVRPRGMSTAEIEAVVESDFVHEADTGAEPGGQAWQLPTRNTYPVVTGVTARSYPGRVDTMVISWDAVPGADYYLIEQSADGLVWTRTGEVSSNSYTAQALYGAVTIIRIAAVGLTRGPWYSVAYALGADYMWVNDSNLMWSNDSNLMWN